MYTQCPQCQVAFRITAEVLQQARGQVRCGSCDTAFNALDHLSEEPPATAATRQSGGNRERNDALLQTLNKLAGPDDVRIEDTGIEWLVVDDDEAGEPEAPAAPTSATGSMRWTFADSDDDTSEASADTAEELDIENAETSEQPVLNEDVAALDQTEPSDEARYDDNTPLPDDFEERNDYAPPPSTPQRRETDFVDNSANDAQADLELSQPDEWTDLLDEFSGGGEKAADGDQVADAAASRQAADHVGDAALGIDDDLEITLDAVPEATEPSVADADIPEAPEATESGASDAENIDDGVDGDVSLVASQLDDLLEAMDSGKFKLADADDPHLAEDTANAEHDSPDRAAESSDVEAVEVTAEEQDSDADIEAETELSLTEMVSVDDETLAASDVDDDAEAAAEVDDNFTFEESTGEFERAIADAEDQILAARNLESAGKNGSESAKSDPAQAAFDANPTDTGGDHAAGGQNDDPVTDIAAMTGNMQIDPDILQAMKDGNLDASMTGEDGAPLVETIVMEGDFVRGALLGGDDDADHDTRSGNRRLSDPASLIDTYISKRDDGNSKDPVSKRRLIAGVAVLAVLLVGQLLHSSRESLATFGLFNQTLGPVYRLFGQDVTPTWDIKGWRFEATTGSTDATDSLLTVTSRIANRSDEALPYPLVHISLTDRYEEIVGSKVLEPGEYLPADSNAARPVPPGESFDATIAIASPSDEATGFKLNVCYRDAPGRVRCAIEDFKAP